MSKYAKAITALVGAVVVIVEPFGIDVDSETQKAIVTLLTALLVYLIPNG